jgi:hypothetical protein
MKKLYTSAKLILLGSVFSFSQFMNAQTTVGFEDANLTTDTYWNGSDGSGAYVENGATFFNDYDITYSSWTGFSVSNVRDDSTAGYGNQYGSISGTGHNSSTFGVGYSIPGNRSVIGFGGEVEFNGVYVNNSTYAAVSMRDGDTFAKQFGSMNGADGNPDGTNGEDWFLLSVFSLDENDNRIDSTGFYLADFRFPNSQDDYIIDEFTYVDLSGLADGWKLEFQLNSSDVGQWGMNTPSYFLIDEFTFTSQLSISEFSNTELVVYPNPAQNILNIESDYSEFLILRMNGQLVYSIQNDTKKIDISGLDQGMYILQVMQNGVPVGQRKFIKQ